MAKIAASIAMQKNAGDGAERTENARTNPVKVDGNCSGDVLENENPGALAGATGIDIESFWSWFDHNLKRHDAASRLVAALLDCAPEDRIPFLEILLHQLHPGFPRVYLIDAMRECRECSVTRKSGLCDPKVWSRQVLVNRQFCPG